MKLEEFRSRLAKLGFNKVQIESLSRPPIYVGQTHDPSADDYVSEGTLEYMGAIPVTSGTIEVKR